MPSLLSYEKQNKTIFAKHFQGQLYLAKLVSHLLKYILTINENAPQNKLILNAYLKISSFLLLLLLLFLLKILHITLS